ncbi:hypothetical protein KAI12_01690 [Candidatus Bathyarchaeota archaeon]|nr:hypothetical protein [Candidatus Bathyarchaeota archaeon]
MDYGKYARASLVVLSGILLFFLGCSFPFQPNLMGIISLVAVVLLTIGWSYSNRRLIGGFLLGLFTSTSFLLGFFLMTIILEVSIFFSTGPIGEVPGLSLLLGLLSQYGLGMLLMVLAFASTGFFFGLVGYIFGNTLPRVLEKKQPYLFRDYWSSVHSLGKSDRREYPYLDRRLRPWNLTKEKLRRALVEKIAEPEADLVFVRDQTGKSSKSNLGRVFDLPSGRMIGSSVVNPHDLVSKYRPLILKVARLSATPKGVRRLALEHLLSRFLEKFLRSWLIWIFYMSLSTVLVLSVYVLRPSDFSAIIGALIASAVTLFFVWRWRTISKDLFEKRPDERVLIFIVYIVLALLFGFYFSVIAYIPSNPETWVESWWMWTPWMLFLSFVLGVGYMLIHRDVEVVNTYFYDNSGSTSGSRSFSGYRDPKDAPYWLGKDDVEGYWVFRFMYFWKYEVTTVPHSDWERVEIWVDAETGIPKWVVTDYHYRELWYKVEGDLPVLYTTFIINFPTPIPITNSKELLRISHVSRKPTKDLIRTSISGTADEFVEDLQDFFDELSEFWVELHPKDWVSGFGLSERAAGFCSALPWTYWRYSYGVEEKERYLRENIGRPENQPQNR